MFSSEIRSVEDIRNESSYEYFSTLVLMPERNNEHFTGTYVCQGVNEPEFQTYYHLYFPGVKNLLRFKSWNQAQSVLIFLKGISDFRQFVTA